jgi:hypothetical protein
MRLRLLLVLLGAVLVVATYTFPIWQPILEQRGAAPIEAFPGLPPQLQSDFLSLPPEQQRAYLAFAQEDQGKAITMVIAALAPRVALPEEDQAMPELSAPTLVASGTFGRIDAIRWAQGTVNIYRDSSNILTLRIEDLRMLNGPDLHVELSAADAPRGTITDMTVNEIVPMDAGLLKASDGDQNYQLPDGTNLSQYRSVVIYSTSLDLVYSFAPLFVRQ